MRQKLTYSLYLIILVGFCMSCFQITIKSFSKEQQLMEISEDAAQDSEEEDQALKKEWNSDLFLEDSYRKFFVNPTVFLNAQRSYHTNYISFIKTILTPPPRIL